MSAAKNTNTTTNTIPATPVVAPATHPAHHNPITKLEHEVVSVVHAVEKDIKNVFSHLHLSPAVEKSIDTEIEGLNAEAKSWLTAHAPKNLLNALINGDEALLSEVDKFIQSLTSKSTPVAPVVAPTAPATDAVDPTHTDATTISTIGEVTPDHV